MDFEYSKKTKMYMEQLADFMNKFVYPNEATFHQQLESSADRWTVPPIMEELKVAARERGLWNLFLPESERGAGLPAGRAVALGESPDDVLYAARNRVYVSRNGGVFWRAVAVELPEIRDVAWA